MSNPKIQHHHQERLAIIYIRQSTLQQVERHGESTKLQYGLVEKAYQLGWSKEQVIVIDDDLGRSGANAEGRPGFQRLVAEVSLDRVGIVWGIEISRLARSCKDWYQLLEVCALFRTLIADTDGIYDPSSYNDRLLLGLKGTMSEAELHVIKQRMVAGKKAKAKRGELGMQLPVGYVKRPSGEIIKDPDEQAQSVLVLIFDLFERFSTVNAVLKYLVTHNIKLPHRERSGLQKGELTWRRANRPTLGNIFHNPIYAGAYVYGRRPTDPRRKKPGRPSTGRTVAKPSEWEVLIKDKVPAYITWNQYERNLRQLASNSNQGIGVPRHGPSLLSGVLVCGRCGLRMSTYYSSCGKKLRYGCTRMSSDYADPVCQSLLGNPLDDLITNHILEAMKPSSLEVSLQVVADIAKEREGLISHWEKQLERACYEVERAYRQYNAAEPENRLVVRTLEKKWEEALAAEEKLKREYTQFLDKQPSVLTEKERHEIEQLASDIPSLWSASTITAKERQEILRLLIERIIVRVEGNTEKVFVEIHWCGGYKTRTSLVRPVAKLEQLSYYNQLLERAKMLSEENMRFVDIAEKLNEEGFRPAKRQEKFNASMVSSLLVKAGVKSNKTTKSEQIARHSDEWTFRELSQKLSIPEPTLYAWMRKGQLTVRRDKAAYNGIWLIYADSQELKRLEDIRNRPRQWIYNSKVQKVH
ncbi:TPA: recombinase family protein [Legionella pneumophila]|nr:recombinase family protein [Legionella pneumophila]HAT2137424.1 recombinase family protein [Legionella pneumophila]HAT2143540.1 recombinase family protein [Legionella pneumophila]HAT2146689.1 recombinase family protein [Legionella pneumophila]HAT2161805.1 recombinase family protein [Legionella pneumophila]